MTEKKNQDNENLSKYRIFLFWGGIAYIFWWFIIRYSTNNQYDIFFHRTILGSFLIVTSLLSYRISFIRRFIGYFYVFGASLITIHYFVVMHLSSLESIYSSYSLLIIYCVSASIFDRMEFFVYAGCTICVTIIVLSIGNPSLQQKILFASSYLTIFPFTFFIITTRHNVLQSLNASDKIVQKRSKELESLNSNLSSTLHNQENLIRKILKLSGTVAESSFRITESGDRLLKRSSDQASSINKVTLSMDAISNQTESNVKLAKNADQLTKQTAEASANGEKSIHALLNAMSNLNESSREISKIIETINAIAFQTNLLALNASVEAARAGKHGKGFAVVANEVRNLAARSSDAASETNILIENAVKNINTGSTVAETNALSLKEINININEVAGLMNMISESGSKQAQDIQRVNTEMIEIDKLTEKNVKGTEKITHASGNLSIDASNIKQILVEWSDAKKD